MEKYVSASSDSGLEPVELFGVGTQKNVKLNPQVTGGEYITLDCGFWLPLAAEHYHISKDLRDYVMVPVPSVITEVPNTNGDCVTKQELLRFVPDLGMPAYRTFKGKPTFEEHANQDITKAKGVILDAYLKPLKGFGNNKHYKLVKLLAFDRTKDALLCNRILKKEVNTYSMGLYFDSYSCSICGNEVGRNSGRPCTHTKLKQPTYLSAGKLVYRHMQGINGFETSAVADPAYTVALSDIILSV